MGSSNQADLDLNTNFESSEILFTTVVKKENGVEMPEPQMENSAGAIPAATPITDTHNLEIPAINLDHDLSDTDLPPPVPSQEPTLASLPRHQRARIMSIIIKYMASKIQNTFPPESRLPNAAPEMPLDRFLLVLTARLRLSLVMFMKGIIYFFRYMDVVHLLRYINQSNNYACVMEMGYGLRKLIVGCFKLALVRERKLDKARRDHRSLMETTLAKACAHPYPRYDQNWTLATGLALSEIAEIVRRIISRLNGKLAIKNIEIVQLKHEIFRFVKMVSE